MKKIKSLLLSVLCLTLLVPGMTVYAAEAATFSEYWFQDSNGSWKVKDNNGNIVKNAWLCDDAVASNGKDVWYLLDSNGDMITAGLVQDGTGNYYSLETNHNGYYGMLRYKSGNYDGINLTLEGSHGGAFAAVLNQDGLNALKSKYGVTSVSISNANCVYTSSFRGAGGSSAQYNNTTQTQQSQANSSNPFESNHGVNGYGNIGEGSSVSPSEVSQEGLENYMKIYGNPNG